MGQAFAFPLPVGWAAFQALHYHSTTATATATSATTTRSNPDTTTTTTFRRLNLGVALASLWLAAASAWSPYFAFGYDLYSTPLKIGASTTHLATAVLSLAVFFWRSTPLIVAPTSSGSFRSDTIRTIRDAIKRLLWNVVGTNPKSPVHMTEDDLLNQRQDGGSHMARMYATCSMGLLWFTILPVISPYPLATIPTILGKRLSRPASAFTFLASIMTYCLKDSTNRDNDPHDSDHDDTSRDHDHDRDCSLLHASRKTMFQMIRTGLATGSAFHLVLLALKIIGVDGGGLLLPGNGLWEVYPAMVAVPFAAASSMLLHGLICYVTTCRSPHKEESTGV
eukprot:CAMPEP_0198283120 /NCGR_PEP_ID=MMETSP1449-20131203/2800_1 /TAXON_ID=420275 /ORGANISM="Attheya septentrionalis, Strain CCMP2084" /LENGTH=336 /DNA_ID=CAMNT_0043979633 /DNA_START=531 /DNA_END=1541 /DNA_ORIENTATION=-